MCFGVVLKRVGAVFVLGACVASAWADSAESMLAPYPALLKLYQAYPAQRATFVNYANRQGFRQPVENLATTVHELVHFSSAAHQGYFMDGVYYEPYLRIEAWPRLTNAIVAPQMFENERGAIYQAYMQNTPQNTLANVVDEINAYGHVLPLVCRLEPESAPKQVRNLVGFLHLQEAYLRVLRTGSQREYQQLIAHREARGALTMVTRRAWKVLQECGVAGGAIPMQEVRMVLGM